MDDASTPPPQAAREQSPPLCSASGLGSRSPLPLASPSAALASPLDRVQVFLRCRPSSTGEEAAVHVTQNTVSVDYRDRNVSFTFDGVFPPQASQEDVYSALAPPLLVDVMDGYEGAILAYGQTGSGKTYSLLHMGGAGGPQDGSPETDVGLFPRLAADLFTSIEADFRNMYAVEMAFIQVYSECVDDLLRPATNLKVRADGADGPAQVENLLWVPVRSAPALLEVFRSGRKRLVYAGEFSQRSKGWPWLHSDVFSSSSSPSSSSETVMNKTSSRSHAVLQLRITKTPRPPPALDAAPAAADGDSGVAVTQLIGRLSIVDLAGSERTKKTHAEGLRLKEATDINVSLLALGNCVAALAGKQRHIPYRDSVLTRLLEPCLGGRSRTLLLACVAPEAEHAGESIGSCEFASRAMRIAIAVQQNSAQVVLSPQALAAALGRAGQDTALAQHGQQILRLEAQLMGAEDAAVRATREAVAARAEATAALDEAANLRTAAATMEAELRAAHEEVRHATAAREFFAAQAGVTEAQAREAAAVAAAQLAEERQRSAAARAAAESEAQARQLLERQLADAEVRGRATAVDAASAVTRAQAEAQAARRAAASALGALTSAWEEATAAQRTYQQALAGDAGEAAAAATRLAAAAQALRVRGEAQQQAWLSCGTVLPKRGRNGKRYARVFRYLHAQRRLEWLAQLSVDGGAKWKGMQLGAAPGCTATLSDGVLTLVTPEVRACVLCVWRACGMSAPS